jgi:hypothetical protein
LIARGMQRLLRVLELEEEQRRAQMEETLADLQRLKRALTNAREQEHRGRHMVAEGARANDVVERLAGAEKSRTALRRSTALRPRMAESEKAAGERREKFLEKRIERRQAEAMIERCKAAERAESTRRGQRFLDDWFLSKMRQCEASARKDPREQDTGERGILEQPKSLIQKDERGKTKLLKRDSFYHF